MLIIFIIITKYYIKNCFAGETDTAGALRLANEYILQEENGMRPLSQGIPRIVIVITDGKSNFKNVTESYATEIKKRGINMISIGVGDADPEELQILSSTLDSMYFVEDFTKIMEIITDITRTNCRQPSLIKTDIHVKTVVNHGAYKYFKFPIKVVGESNLTLAYPTDLTIELQEFTGESEVYFSFKDMNPKSDSEFLGEEFQTKERDQNFIESTFETEPIIKSSSIVKKNKKSDESGSLKKSTFYQVKNTDNDDTLYISVKGLNGVNTIQLNVFDRSVFAPVKQTISNGQVSINKSLSVLSMILMSIVAQLNVF